MYFPFSEPHKWEKSAVQPKGIDSEFPQFLYSSFT